MSDAGKDWKVECWLFQVLSISFDLDESLSVIFKLSACVKINKKVNVQKILVCNQTNLKQS